MSSCPVPVSPSTPYGALKRLTRFVAALDEFPDPIDDFESFELEVRDMVMEVEAEIVARGLAKQDTDLPVVLIVNERRAGLSVTSWTGPSALFLHICP